MQALLPVDSTSVTWSCLSPENDLVLGDDLNRGPIPIFNRLDAANDLAPGQ